MKQSFCGKQRRQRGWNDFSTSSYYTRSGRTVKLNFETRESQMTFLLSTIYSSALVIISLPTPTFHCMFTWLPSLLCTSCAGGTKSERQRHPEQVEPCTDCPFTSEISVKREHGILIPVMRYFYFLMSVIRVRDLCVEEDLFLFSIVHQSLNTANVHVIALPPRLGTRVSTVGLHVSGIISPSFDS